MLQIRPDSFAIIAGISGTSKLLEARNRVGFDFDFAWRVARCWHLVAAVRNVLPTGKSFIITCRQAGTNPRLFAALTCFRLRLPCSVVFYVPLVTTTKVYVGRLEQLHNSPSFPSALLCLHISYDHLSASLRHPRPHSSSCSAPTSCRVSTTKLSLPCTLATSQGNSSLAFTQGAQPIFGTARRQVSCTTFCIVHVDVFLPRAYSQTECPMVGAGFKSDFSIGT